MSKEEKHDLGITVKKDENLSEWYSQVIQKAELAEYSSVSGCIVFRPWAYAIWEKIQTHLDAEIKKTGHRNAYFPLFIPESLLKKEAKHIEGFSPEVAWVTHAGDSKLDERLAVRPTSETIMYESYAKWVRSWRDLPLLINQWCNVVRWEFKHPKPFLRTREFLWQEGHTVHATEKGADKEALDILDIYTIMIRNLLAIEVITGKKTEMEKFAGALYTTTMEALMPDMKALQMGTSHNLGQNFARVFDIKYLDKNDKEQYAWQTSWGVSTRLIGALIMAHGDDKGLVLPPKLAPVQVVIVPILFDKSRKTVLHEAKKIKMELENAGFSVELDDRDSYTAGFKFNQWELKGVPLRIEIGPRDIEKKHVVLARRDNGKKEFVSRKTVVNKVLDSLDSMQKDLYKKNRKFLENHIIKPKNKKEFMDAIIRKKGLVKADWCSTEKCEIEIKDATGAHPRVIPFDSQGKGKCIYCGKKAEVAAYFARAY